MAAGTNFLSAKGRQVHVLLAEDNVTTQSLISILMQQIGVQLSIADNGQDAVAQATTHAFDLILMDCLMPQMNGFETATYLRQKGLDIPIIALTACARTEDEEACLKAGMDDFLSKPFRQSDLREVLVRWLGADALENTLL